MRVLFYLVGEQPEIFAPVRFHTVVANPLWSSAVARADPMRPAPMTVTLFMPRARPFIHHRFRRSRPQRQSDSQGSSPIPRVNAFRARNYRLCSAMQRMDSLSAIRNPINVSEKSAFRT